MERRELFVGLNNIRFKQESLEKQKARAKWINLGGSKILNNQLEKNEK